MGLVTIQPGNRYDLVTPAEMMAGFQEQQRQIHTMIREEIRGVKQIKAKGKLLDNNAGTIVGVINGPQPGYVWFLRRFTTWEPTTAAGSLAAFLSYSADGTPRNDNGIMVGTVPAFWSFNKGSSVINPGDDLVITWTGTNSLKTFYLNAEVTEVPAEMAGKLLVMATYITLGSRYQTASPDTTGNNVGNWTAAFDEAAMNVKVEYFEVYHMVVENGLPGSKVRVNVDNRRWDIAVAGDNNSWDPQQPLLLRPGETLYFYWNDATSDNTPATVTIWLRYDRDIPVNEALGAKNGG